MKNGRNCYSNTKSPLAFNTKKTNMGIFEADKALVTNLRLSTLSSHVIMFYP